MTACFTYYYSGEC
uniref:Uncharacterized protein n=1 Tax=Macrostomum lignano TaxID=282301 RepID=A0A1I8FZD0_9PLAT